VSENIKRSLAAHLLSLDRSETHLKNATGTFSERYANTIVTGLSLSRSRDLVIGCSTYLFNYLIKSNPYQRRTPYAGAGAGAARVGLLCSVHDDNDNDNNAEQVAMAGIITQVSQTPVQANIQPPLLTRLSLDLRGKRFSVDRETIMNLPESVLLCLFPNGLVLSRQATSPTEPGEHAEEEEVYGVDVRRVALLFPGDCS